MKKFSHNLLNNPNSIAVVWLHPTCYYFIIA